jgi:lysozyme family protein
MGNSQHRYLTNNEAVEILGQQHWRKVKAKFEKANPGKFVDLSLFASIIHSRIERMVRSHTIDVTI